MDKDLILRELFDLMAMHTSSKAGSAKFRLGGVEYDVCCSGVLQISAFEEDIKEMKNGVLYPYSSEQKQMVLTDLNKVKPELALEYDSIKLTDSKFDHCDQKYCLLPVAKPPFGKKGFWVLEYDEDQECFTYLRTLSFGNTRFIKDMHMLAFRMPELIGEHIKSHGAKLSDFDGRIMCKRFANVAALSLVGDTGLLYIAMATVNVHSPAYQRIIVGDDVYMCDGLETVMLPTSRGEVPFYKFNNLMKGQKDMMKLANPVPDKAANIESAVAASDLVTVASPNDQEINEAVKAPVVQNEAPKPAKPRLGLAGIGAPRRKLAVAEPAPEVTEAESTPEATDGDTNAQTADLVQEVQQEAVAEPVMEQTEAAAPEENATEEQATESQSQEQVTDKPKRRKTKAATAAGGFDLEAVIEYLGTPVQGVQVGDLERVLSEIRNLRDIQITAARRSANLTSEICKMSANGLQTLAELQAVLNRK